MKYWRTTNLNLHLKWQCDLRTFNQIIHIHASYFNLTQQSKYSKLRHSNENNIRDFIMHQINQNDIFIFSNFSPNCVPTTHRRSRKKPIRKIKIRYMNPRNRRKGTSWRETERKPRSGNKSGKIDFVNRVGERTLGIPGSHRREPYRRRYLQTHPLPHWILTRWLRTDGRVIGLGITFESFSNRCTRPSRDE